MKPLLPIALALLLLSLFKSAYAEKIHWVTFDYPPVYILDGPDKDKGYGDRVRQELEKCLDQDKSESFGDLTFSRFIAQLKKRDEVYCMAALGGFPDEVKEAYYSKVSLVNPSSVIIVRKRDFSKFGASNGMVSLEKVLKTDLVGAKVKNGTYGIEVANLLKKYPGKVLERSLTDPATFFRLLTLNQVDYVFGYPYGFFYNRTKLKASDRDQIDFLRIEENPPMLNAYALCSRNPKGEVIISKINACLSRPEIKKVIAGAVAMHMPQSLREEVKRINLKRVGK